MIRNWTHYYQPFDRKSGNPWLFSKNVSSNSLQNRLWRGVGIELVRVVLVIDIVSNSHEFTAIVSTGEEDNGDAENFGIWDSRSVGRVGLEYEFIDSDRYWAYEERIELLIVFITAYVSSGFGLGGCDRYDVAEPT